MQEEINSHRHANRNDEALYDSGINFLRQARPAITAHRSPCHQQNRHGPDNNFRQDEGNQRQTPEDGGQHNPDTVHGVDVTQMRDAQQGKHQNAGTSAEKSSIGRDGKLHGRHAQRR